MLSSATALAQGGGPLSAIDWLSQSIAAPPGQDTGGIAVAIDEPPVTGQGGALPLPVATTALDGPSPDATGLIPVAISGLPRNLWGAGLTREIAAELVAHSDDDLPALRQLFLTILLAEVDAPVDAAGKGELLQVRIDKLLALGALEQAAALIDAAGATTPEMFRRSFDVALLTGAEDRACERMAATPDLAPTVPARISGIPLPLPCTAPKRWVRSPLIRPPCWRGSLTPTSSKVNRRPRLPLRSRRWTG